MPNPNNILSPITLFGTPRSGTSVLYRALTEHPDVEGGGESANLVFTTWRALEQISGVTRYGKIALKDYGADGARLVQQAFLTVFPSEKKEWMHKPIGVPRIHADFPGTEPESETFVQWYWMVFSRSFPQSRNLAILRNPLDVVLSMTRYLDVPDSTVWRSLNFLYRSLALAPEKPRIVVTYEQLVAEPEMTLKRICEAVSLTFHPRMLRAFDRLHVPARGVMFGTPEDLQERRARGFSHQHEREALALGPDARRAIGRYHELLAVFGLPADSGAPMVERSAG